MVWFKKEGEENIPELPSLPSIEFPSGPEEVDSLQEVSVPSVPSISPVLDRGLPSLPSSPEEEIKSAIRSEPVSALASKVPVFKSESEKHFESPRTVEMLESKKYVKKDEPVYVRLDKFETTVESFEEIRKKVFEIEKLLGRIKDIKLQEEKELMEWENEIQVIKARIDAVDRNIFDKLD